MKTRNTLILIFLVLAALVLSALVGTLTQNIDFLKWLTWGDSIGFDAIQLDLAIIDLSFSFKMQVNVLQVIAIGAALFIYRKVR
ncbi:MAG: DUF4321 domain-containing protein [Clostridia bacterium]|nr:DUF4321 domain-containing protein [Clostridia bacterium]